MGLFYYDDKHFIGIIKFFDTNKDFGYVASNNCNMPTTNYKQELYVNSTSFIDEDAKKKDCVVVFQVEELSNRKRKAVNIRLFRNTAEDIDIALMYYGDHERIEIENNRRVLQINLFNVLNVPRRNLGLLVAQRIIKKKNRSPESTLEEFRSFVNHYAIGHVIGSQYIFDRDYKMEEKLVWDSLFSIFTDEESLEILKCYPTTCRYISNSKVFNDWIQSLPESYSSLLELDKLQKTSIYFPSNFQDLIRNKIESNAEHLLQNRLSEVCQEIEMSEVVLNEIIKPYLNYTTINHQDDIKKVLNKVRYNKYKASVVDFFNDRRGSVELLFKSFAALGDEKDKYLMEYINSIRKKLDNAIKDKKYGLAISFLDEVSKYDKEFVVNYKRKLFPHIKEFLADTLKSSLKSGYQFKDSFCHQYNNLTSLYDEKDVENILLELRPIMLESDSLTFLSYCSIEMNNWLSKDDAIKRAFEIIRSLSFEDFEAFVNARQKLFDDDIAFSDIIVQKALSYIKTKSLSEYFNGKKRVSKNRYIEDSEVFSRNCSFLNDVKQYVKNSSPSIQDQWCQFINSQGVVETWILYKQKIISEIPESIYITLINNLSLNDVKGKRSGWYYEPTLSNPYYNELLSNSERDIPSIIANRLLSIKITRENIDLIVFLLELMKTNRYTEGIYNQDKWEENLLRQLAILKKTHNNSLFSIIIWAIHNKTSASINALKEYFSLLPPYLQIKSTKKLFELISRGLLEHTADSLYNLITNDGLNNICFPLEITFEYLKLREIDSSVTLDNNRMIQLINRREDHSNWHEISLLLNPCKGRWYVEQLAHDRSNYRYNSFFNGIIQNVNKTIKVFVPNKMVDSFGRIQIYNNKYFKQVQEFIKISYHKKDYQVQNTTEGVEYFFDNSHKVDIFSLARRFNFIYNELDNFHEFNVDEGESDFICECRASETLDNEHGYAFNWCCNKPCYSPLARYHLNSEWGRYTILDFMRILDIPTSYESRDGKEIRYGHYIILSSFIKNFDIFYEHLKCRKCGRVMKPLDISKYATRALTEFSCVNEACCENGRPVYLNHCFNKQSCNSIIDSRDSNTCPNGQYICPKCGACCSTENFKLRRDNLLKTEGAVSDWLLKFIDSNKGHWEKKEFYCYKCGKKILNGKCDDCGVEY